MQSNRPAPPLLRSLCPAKKTITQKTSAAHAPHQPSGTRVRNAEVLDRLQKSGADAWAVHARARELRAQGRDIIELTIGEPDVAPEPGLLEACQRSMAAGRVKYSNGRGEPDLLAALAARYRTRRAEVSERNFICFPGAQTALYAVLRGLVGPGDAVLVGDPYYATYDSVIAACGAERISVPLTAEHGFRMQADHLRAAATDASRVLLLNNPHNPTGAVLSQQDVIAIGEVCRQRNLWLVCDEVYEELIFNGAFVSPFELPELADRVISISSISKTHAAPGFRSGWAVGPEPLIDKLLPLAEAILFGNQPFIADATAWALTSETEPSQAMRASYQRRSAVVARVLAGSERLRPIPPRSGMFHLVDVSETGMDGETFAWALLDVGVAVMPGGSFGANARDYVRLALTAPDEMIEEACRRIARFAESF